MEPSAVGEGGDGPGVGLYFGRCGPPRAGGGGRGEGEHVAVTGGRGAELYARAEECFVLQVAGGSEVDGGRRPIQDGERVVLRWVRGVGFDAVVGGGAGGAGLG
ncbi:MAG: hypothetical protein R3F65_21840 [bacterium]